jgi:hypothetical protein
VASINLVRRYPFLIAGLVAGLVVRIFAMRSGWGYVNTDVATGMLMAEASSHGHFYTFLWGQNYGGTFVLILEAPLVRLFGVHLMIFRTVDLTLLLIDVLLLRSIARRLVSAHEADIATLLFWMFPPAWVQWTGLEYVFWTSGIGFVLASVWSAFRWIETNDDRWLIGVGLGTGLAIWSYPLMLTLLIPVIAGVVWRLRRRLWRAVMLATGASVGLIPIIYSTLGRGVSVLGRPAASSNSIVHRFGSGILRVVPSSILFNTKWERQDVVLDLVGIGLFSGVAYFTIYHFVKYGRSLGSPALYATTELTPHRKASKGTISDDLAWTLVGCTILFWPIVFVLSRVQGGVLDRRYAFVMLPPLIVIAAHLLNRLRLGVPGVVAAFAMTALVASSSTGGFTAFNEYASYKAIEQVLQRDHRTHIYAGYWISYPLSLFSNEEITASDVPVSPLVPLVRDLAFEQLAIAAPKATYVVQSNAHLDSILKSWVHQHHRGSRNVIDGFAIFRFDFPLPPSQIPHLYGAF